MSVLQDILAWSLNRPGWQRDALRRLVVNGELDDPDIAELTRVCKAPYGLDDPALPAPAPIPLAPEHLGVPGATVPSVRVLGIRDAAHVNALADGQRLGFSPDGFTLIYGDNGSGKSGYARVLRQVCRARARGDAILPNVFDSEASGGLPSATIDYRVGDADRTVRWQSGQPAPPELAAVSFFDSTCASVHVCGANELAYTPFGLDVLTKLVSACQRISESLMREYSQLELAKPASLQQPSAKEGTEVRSRLDALAAGNTDIQILERLATLTEEENARIGELRRVLAEDPSAAARELRVRLGRVTRLAEEIARTETSLGSAAVARVRDLFRDVQARESAARVAAEKAFGNLPLPEVGSEVWRGLWKSARRYSQREAYPGRQFPFAEDDARCVLCQQPLSAETKSRLRQFEDFIRRDTQQRAQRARCELDDAFQAMAEMRLRRHDYVDSLNDILLEDEALAGRIREFLVRIRLRRRMILLSCSNGAWSDPPSAARGTWRCSCSSELDNDPEGPATGSGGRLGGKGQASGRIGRATGSTMAVGHSGRRSC